MTEYGTKEKIFDVKGFKIAYTDIGPEEGRILFCVHGLLSNGRDYDFLGAALAEKGYRVISIDLSGRGRSNRLPDPSLYVLPNYIPSCLALLAHVTGGKEFDWLGVSLGGMIGMVVAGMKAIKMGRLIIVDIGPEVSGNALDIVASYAKTPNAFATKEEAIAFLKYRCSAWGITDDKIWDHLIAHNIVPHEDGYAMHYDAGIGEALKDRNDTISFWPIWKKIRQSVLLIRGGKSVILPQEIADKMQRLYKGVSMQTITFPDCGHVPNLMQDEHIKPILSWLQTPVQKQMGLLQILKSKLGI